MIKGKTTSGFEYSISPKVFHSMKVIRKVAKIEENTSISETFDVMEEILGWEQFENLMEHCDEAATDDHYADAIFSEAMQEMFANLSEDKQAKN